jgi:hypothetical protein
MERVYRLPLGPACRVLRGCSVGRSAWRARGSLELIPSMRSDGARSPIPFDDPLTLKRLR